MVMKALLILLIFLSFTVPAFADFVTSTGVFTITSGTGTQSVTDAACVQPKAILFWWTRSTANATASASAGYGIGAAVDAVSDQQGDAAIFSLDNQATSDSAYARSYNHIIHDIANGSAGSNVTATISSFNSNGFTINKDANDGTNLHIVHYLCLGGSDITNAYLGDFSLTSGTGSKAFTGVGFQGNLLIAFGARSATGSDTGTQASLFLGVANGTQQDVAHVYIRDASTSANVNKSYIDSGNTVIFADPGGGFVSAKASFTSFDADGFTLNAGTNVDGGAHGFLGLVLKGTFRSHIGQQARATGTGNQDITSASFQPTTVLLAGTFATANATETTQSHLIIGAGTSSSDDNGTWASDAATINTDSNQYSSSANIYSQLTNPSTIASQAGLSSMLSNGYRLNFGTADANARLFYHLALAGAPVVSRRPLTPMVLN